MRSYFKYINNINFIPKTDTFLYELLHNNECQQLNICISYPMPPFYKYHIVSPPISQYWITFVLEKKKNLLTCNLFLIYPFLIKFMLNKTLICSMLVKPITAVDFHKPHADVVYLLQTCVTVTILLHFCTTPAIFSLQVAPGVFTIWAPSWQNQQNGMCTQWRLRSAWASTQSD